MYPPAPDPPERGTNALTLMPLTPIIPIVLIIHPPTPLLQGGTVMRPIPVMPLPLSWRGGVVGVMYPPACVSAPPSLWGYTAPTTAPGGTPLEEVAGVCAGCNDCRGGDYTGCIGCRGYDDWIV